MAWVAKKMTRLNFLKVCAATTAALYGVQPMKTQITARIPATEEELPRLGLGTYATFDVATDTLEFAEVREVLAEFHRLGGRLIDSSPMYGAAEAATGVASTLLGINPQLFIATKVWTSGAAQGAQQMRESLAKLRRQKIELMQIHNLVDWRTQIKALRAGKEGGIYKYVGITHYMTSAFGEIEKIVRAEKLDFIQIPYSIGEITAEQRLLGAAAERGVAVIANEPFAQGALFRFVRNKSVPGWAVEKGINSWAQYFLKFILSNPQVQFVIPATRKLAHLRENMAGGSGYLPSAAERARMQKEFAAI